jgi:hypothetical protein
MWQVDIVDSHNRQYPAAVPVPAPASPVPDQVPVLALDPLAAAAIQSEGSVMLNSIVPLVAVAVVAGTDPEYKRRTAETPAVLSV